LFYSHEEIMEKMLKKLRDKRLLIFLAAISALVSFTPIIVQWEFAGIEQETVEALILLSFSAIVLLTASFYSRKLILRSQTVNETVTQLGVVNLQVQQLRSVFEDVKNFPETRLEFKVLVSGFAEKILSIINCQWVTFRLVETGGRHNTLLEYSQARGGAVLPAKNKLSNKMLFDDEPLPGAAIISSNQDNLGVKTFCIISVDAINENQKGLIGIIVNNLSIYYLFFVAVFQKKAARASEK